MPQGFNPSEIEFFRGALPEAVFWGRIALAVGASGLVASLLLVLAHVRDRLSLRRGRRGPTEYRPPSWGPLRRALGEFFADPLHVAPLSPDAASDYVTGRLDAGRDVTQSVIRYFSYAPLLLGLMGTTFALRTLLVTGGNTLQEIQPQLSGVFAGTLAGIAGSLLAAIGGLVLDRVSLSSANSVQDFVHRFILPMLPERRISVRIEEAVLTEIAERAQAVAESFRRAIAPVATELQELAIRSGKAAEEATNAFSEAARAVREAGDLEVASRNFKAGAHMIDSSAEQLTNATKETSEVLLRAGEIRGALAGLLDRIQTVSENLSGASERVGSGLSAQLSDLNAQMFKIDAAASGLRSAVDVLSTELTRRAVSDSAQVEAIQTYAASADRILNDLAETARISADAARGLEVRLGDARQRTAEALAEEVTPRLEEYAKQTDRTLGDFSQALSRYGTDAATALADIRQRLDGAGALDSRAITANLHEIADGVRRNSAEHRSISEELRRLASRQSPSPRQPAKGLFGWLRR